MKHLHELDTDEICKIAHKIKKLNSDSGIVNMCKAMREVSDLNLKECRAIAIIIDNLSK